MTKAPYYAFPGIEKEPFKVVSKVYKLDYFEVFMKSRIERFVKARQTVFFLEYLKGKTEKEIGKKYGFVASNINHAKRQVLNRIQFYKEERQLIAQMAELCGLSEEFNNKTKTLRA